jgi:divalent metal cation (Fe/Co/Zn/Cd) transporter
VEVAPEMPVRMAHEIAHAVKDRVRAALPAVADVLVHLEPAREQAPEAGGVAAAS